MSEPTRLLFVCMGNICRSPLAEGVFIHLARERGVLERFEVDSCGTGGWHAGEAADARAAAVARKHGVHLPSRARKVDPRRDFERFHWLLTMDRDNTERLLDLGAPRERLRLLRSFDPGLAHLSGMDERLEVPDPYYGGPEGFDRVYEMVHAACAGLLGALMGGTAAKSFESD